MNGGLEAKVQEGGKFSCPCSIISYLACMGPLVICRALAGHGQSRCTWRPFTSLRHLAALHGPFELCKHHTINYEMITNLDLQAPTYRKVNANWSR